MLSGSLEGSQTRLGCGLVGSLRFLATYKEQPRGNIYGRFMSYLY